MKTKTNVNAGRFVAEQGGIGGLLKK